ncbi:MULTISPECIES: 3-deoxy-D-manno-octulosonic acid transferase [Acinetobacter]|uniref:3-deoxy-D-manno-octulosonic acid transferase n=1 Tax=Acinetobacter TaxID=469 RepID=UPI00141A8CD9|nr:MULTISPECIES: 3-deoxy-D-manno-octulosonic acid transferase [Acinetobacter]MCS4300165.1 3-deoxy-D-manno-octulosonic-acid transferase [Acinetobacter guillouiae]MCW2253505.1 3-deoxy-D-manno-octulosonic-acid transferase [Acinetobacter sp. BIGb0204]NII37701.1 3-deoxy-D-manno-octulosonic-acid transferase [Acinetobacter sp. BIGb0196]
MATPFWYNTALKIVKPLYQWRIKKRAKDSAEYQQECLERFGPFQDVKNQHAIWFHCVSVGETNAAQPLIEHYLKAGHAVLVTNTTKTGQARAKSLFLKAPYQALFQAVYLPADQRYLVADFYQKYQPKLLILVETELWPNLIDQAQQFKVPCILVNARLSEKSAKGYAKVPSLTRPMLQKLDQLLAQDVATQQRFIDLGIPQNKIQVLGSIKFDISAPEQFIHKAQQLQQDWNLANRKIITIASTHAPEEEKLFLAFKTYLEQYPDWLLIVVPRHPERFDEVFAAAQSLNLTTQRRSLEQAIESNTQVYLADSMGEMWLWYALSQACFVGGSLNEPGGGHNILEAMVLDVPTVIGPHYFNFQAIVDEFLQADALKVGQTVDEVVQLLVRCLEDQAFAQQLSQHAIDVLKRNQGSLYKHIAVIDQYL